MVVDIRLVDAHPFGGVEQKTVVSDLSDVIAIEYETHFGPELLLTLSPDKNLDGIFDPQEKIDFLARVHSLLVPNISYKLGTDFLQPREMKRTLLLDDDNDFKNGIRTIFVWHVALPKDVGRIEGQLRILDNNFRSGEMKQLSYFVTVLGEIGPIKLASEGRELLLDLSGTKRAGSGATEHHVLHSQLLEGHTKENELDDHVQQEASALIAFLKNESGGIGLYLVGFITAFILGAFHALSPGHGKAMVAAYLVGTRGRVVDAVRLGVVVTVTHVISVLVLGAIALVLSKYTLSQNVYPWLGFASGMIIFLTGYFLLARTAFAVNNHHHHHDHHHGHPEVGHQSTHSLKEIISLGIAGGLVPCPSAIVILLFAIAVNRIATGLCLILSFSLGLAAVLIIIGILTVTASKRIERLGSGVGWIKRLPIFTAGIIMILGIAIGLNSLLRAGILTLHL